MTLTHMQAMVLFALAVSVTFGCLTKQTFRERLRYTAWSLLAFIAIAVLVGWLIFPLSH